MDWACAALASMSSRKKSTVPSVRNPFAAEHPSTAADAEVAAAEA